MGVLSHSRQNDSQHRWDPSQNDSQHRWERSNTGSAEVIHVCFKSGHCWVPSSSILVELGAYKHRPIWARGVRQLWPVIGSIGAMYASLPDTSQESSQHPAVTRFESFSFASPQLLHRIDVVSAAAEHHERWEGDPALMAMLTALAAGCSGECPPSGSESQASAGAMASADD